MHGGETSIDASGASGAAVDAIDMLDLAPYRTARRIERLAHDPDGIDVRWDDGQDSRFDAVWLRDNCACPACRHPHALERRFALADLPETVAIGDATLTEAGNVLLRFAPEAADETPHVSRFTAAWLRHHDYSEAARAARAPKPLLWDADHAARVANFDFTTVMTEDAALRDWLAALRDRGIALVRGAPAAAGQLQPLAERIGPPRQTNFGAIFDVVSKPNPNASADTAMGLEPHTDLANLCWPPDIFLLFCVEHSVRGGESTVVDGFRAAEELRATDPAAFGILTTRPVDFRFHDENYDLRHRALTIELDADGRLGAVRFNNWLRAALDVPPADIQPTYRALCSFWRILRDPRFLVRLRLRPGEVLTIDNRRVLHGRMPFDESSGRRHYQGCHVDRDFMLSRLRLLER